MKKSLFVHYRDCRIDDHMGLYEAFTQSESVILLGIFDPKLQKLPLESPLPLSHRHNLGAQIEALNLLKETYHKREIHLPLFCGDSMEILKTIHETQGYSRLYYTYTPEIFHSQNHREIRDFCAKNSIEYCPVVDDAVSLHEVKNKKNETYKVFTPYYKAWRQALFNGQMAAVRSEEVVNRKRTYFLSAHTCVQLKDYSDAYETLAYLIEKERRIFYTESFKNAQAHWKLFLDFALSAYEARRDYPALKGTSQLSLSLNNGVISYRQVVYESYQLGAESFLRQLAWRSFYKMIYDAYPEVEKQAFLKVFDSLKWSNEEAFIQAWKMGNTGVAIVDAAMNELSKTGRMHNRLRMISATFLVKNLDVDWKIGEAYFYELLADGDPSLNNGGWQWCASTGCDAQPYFRMFNPYLQEKKYDPKHEYIDNWLSDEQKNKEAIVDIKVSNKMAKLKYEMQRKGAKEYDDEFHR